MNFGFKILLNGISNKIINTTVSWSYLITHVTSHQKFGGSCMRGSRKFFQSGANVSLFLFILVDEGNDDPNSTKNGPSSSRQRNAILMAFHWRPMVAQH